MSARYIATEYKRHYTQSHRAKQTWVDLSGVRLLRCRTSCCSSRTSPHGRGRSDHRDVHPDQLSCAQFQAIAWPGPVRFRSTCRALSMADVPGYCLSFPGAGCRNPCEMQVVARFHEVLSVPPRRAPVVLLHAPIRADGLVQITVNVTVPSCAAVLAPFWGILEASSRRRPRLTVCARVFWFRRSEQRHGARSRGPRVAGLTDRQRS